MSPEPEDEELFHYLLGASEGARAAELTAWSRSSPERASRLAALRGLLSALEHVEPTLDLVASIEARISARKVAPPRRRFAWFALAAAAGLALGVLALRPSAEEPRTKGTNVTPETWAGVRVYRPQGEGRPVPLEGVLAASDNLLFAYTNGGPTPFTHLLVFAVGATGQVYWYYPAWVNSSEDPEAISIGASDEPIELHEQIAQPLPPGRLVLHAVFARRAMRVSEIERVIAARDAGGERLPLPDTAQQRSVLEVH